MKRLTLEALRFVRRAAARFHRRDVVPFVTAVSTVVIATLLTVVGTAEPTTLRMSRRIIAEPVRVLSWTHKPARPVRTSSGSVSPAPACPQMTNPGGLRWVGSSDAGPWPTNGTVRLDRFGVTAPIVKVGVNLNNEMVVPHNAREVGWLDQGPYPGDTQNVVLAGHIRYSGVPGSFGRIVEMRPGDTVVVEMDGKRWEYRVVWTCLFDRQTKLAEQIMGYTDVPSLTLISCNGVFDRVAGTRNRRVAVRAELVSST